MTRHYLLAVVLAAVLPSCFGDIEATASELPAAAERHIGRASELRDRGDLRASIIELKNAVQKAPGSHQARWRLGLAYLDSGDGASAEKELRRAMELGMEPEDVAISLTRALQMQGKYQEALDIGVEAGSLPPSQARRLMALQGMSRLRLSQWDEAASLFEAVLADDPQNAEAGVGKALLALSLGHTASARDEVLKVLQSNPDDASALSLFGRLEMFAGNLDAAEKALFEAAERETPARAETHVLLALAQLKQRRYETAAEHLQTAERLAPGSPIPYGLKGALYLAQGRYQDAQLAFDRALTLSPDYPAALVFGALNGMLLGNLEIARSQLDRYLSLDPTNRLALGLLDRIQQQEVDPDELRALVSRLLAGGASDALAGEAPKGDSSATAKPEPATPMDTAESGDGRREATPKSPERLVKSGVELLRKGDSNAGIQALKQALELAPYDREARERLIMVYMDRNDHDAALEAARAYQERFPADVRPELMLGLVYLRSKEYEAAAEAFSAALTEEPDNEAAHRGLATAAAAQGDPAQAEQHFSEAIRLAPDNLEARINLARLQNQQGKPESARETLREAVARAPGALEPRLLLAQLLLDAKEPAAAAALLQAVQRTHGSDERLLRTLARAQMESGEYEHAESNLRELALRLPDDARVRFELARSLDRLGRTDEARNELQQVASLDPSLISPHKSLLRLALAQGDLEQARASLSALRALVPADDTDLLLLGAQVAELEGDLPSAIGDLRRLIAQAPNGVLVSRLAYDQWQAGDKDGAVTTLEEWVDREPNSVRQQLELAQRYLDLGRPESAVAAYRRVLESEPDNVLALNNLASLLTNEDPKTALGLARRAAAAAPNTRSVTLTLLEATRASGDTDGALRIAEAALQSWPEDPDFRLMRAELVAAEGRGGEAR